MKDSLGLRQLRVARDGYLGSQNSLAAELGIDSGQFSRIMQGKKPPNRTEAAAIWRRFRIAPDAWDEFIEPEESTESTPPAAE